MGLYVKKRWIADSSEQIAGGEEVRIHHRVSRVAAEIAEKTENRTKIYVWSPRGICRASGACVFSLAGFPALTRWAKFCRASGAGTMKDLQNAN